jgi:DNA-binding transcriptional MerR regulator
MSFSLPEKEYFTIGEVSDLTQVQPYVLRYWEGEFNLLRPLRRESGHRKFSRKDVELIHRIKDLLYAKGFTIAGAKKYIQQENRKGPEQLRIELAENGAAVDLLKETKETLEEVLKILR